ncbi:hypothetical protein DKX38_012542 [Salix brachista]|uniref:Uncharacterized protein n=1 Tax=Salix brachista TaxID=2182728 RepID=A0A5N5LP44_9ROSI|nr:hypothetical protein DKX38_012542 [Salix brachista]
MPGYLGAGPNRQGPLPKYPVILILDDSTVDASNNNYINTLLRANSFPFGQNYPDQKATGRFSGGELIPDMLASALKIEDAVRTLHSCKYFSIDIIFSIIYELTGELYDLGCRSMAVAGLPSFGYAPIEKTIQMATKLLLPVDLTWAALHNKIFGNKERMLRDWTFRTVTLA